MCTVTLLRFDDRIRIACNRDEQRTRPAAHPPRVVSIHGTRAIMPIDPTGGGTWIAANEHGLVMALLNLNQRDATPTPAAQSRGLIIPWLIGHETAREAASAAQQQLHPEQFGPFRLIIIDRESVEEVTSNRISLRHRSISSTAAMWTSSGLGDHLVESPRKELLEEMIDTHGPTPELQDLFHRHHWPDRPHLSVCMRRQDAHTVSHTLIEIDQTLVSLAYHPAPPGQPAIDHIIRLPLLQPVQS